ncbi:MAG: hypothetical protein ACI4AQ_02645 [Lachnospiraceae bacterium]
MTTIFAGSLFFVYLFSCITIINYSGFNYQQKISLIYITNMGMVYIGLIGARYSLFLLMVILYLYEEFLQTEDRDKNMIITNPLYKFLDYCYLCVFKDYVIWVWMALFMNSYTVQNILGEWYAFSAYGSLIPLFICFHKLYAQKYHLNTITGMYETFNQNAYDKLPFDNEHVQKVFHLISAIEDKSYYRRKNTYSWFSFEFIQYRLERRRKYQSHQFHYKRKFHVLRYLKRPVYYGKLFCKRIHGKMQIIKGRIRMAFRGYSTIEMQYIRMVGILSNRRKYPVRRKIYELIYTKIFFTSVKNYYKRNMYVKAGVFKDYLMYQYINLVPTKINGKAFEHFADAFASRNILKWDINCVAVAVLGLNSNGIYRERLELYWDIFHEYGIDAEKVLELADKIKRGKMKNLREEK